MEQTRWLPGMYEIKLILPLLLQPVGTRRSNLRLDYLCEGGAADRPRLSTTAVSLYVVVLADVGQTTEGDDGFGAEAVVEGAVRALPDDFGREDEG